MVFERSFMHKYEESRPRMKIENLCNCLSKRRMPLMFDKTRKQASEQASEPATEPATRQLARQLASELTARGLGCQLASLL